MIFQSLKPENITIAFTAYNILEYLQLAIYSFLELYPDYKQSIVVFDDDSNDGTIEWLASEGIKRISWKTSESFALSIKKYSKLLNTQDREYQINQSYRNSIMIKEVFNQTTTKYLLLNDADVIFIKPFLEKYEKQVTKYNHVLIAQPETYNYGWKYYNKYPTERAKNLFFGKYINLYKFNSDTKEEGMERLHFFHSLFDLEYFKSKNMIFDNIVDKDFIKLIFSHATLETGSSFYHQILEKNIPFYSLDNCFNRWNPRLKDYRPCTNEEFDKYDVYHFRWVSSFRRFKSEMPEHAYHNTFLKINKDFKVEKLKNLVLNLQKKYNLKPIIDPIWDK